MRKLLFIPLLFICSLAQAQCVGEIKDVKIDIRTGSVIVETEYKMNGVVIQAAGRNRFLNTSGENGAIVRKVRKDITLHCRNLLRRMDGNEQFIMTEKQKRLDQLKVGRTSESIIKDIKSVLVGNVSSVSEVVTSFKGKDIKVTHEKVHTVTNTVIVP